MYRLKKDYLGDKTKSNALDCRNAAELLQQRAQVAFRGKRLAMIELYYGRGATCRQLAALIGKSEGQTYRLLTSLVRKLGEEDCVFFLRNRNKFTSREQKFIETNVFDGVGLRKVAARFDCSTYQVRQAIAKLRLLNKIEKSNRKGGSQWR